MYTMGVVLAEVSFSADSLGTVALNRFVKSEHWFATCMPTEVFKDPC